MKRDIAEKWIAELRSGKWKQGKYSLSLNDKFCCLGVLCELAVKENVCEKVNRERDVVYDEEDVSLPLSVTKWAGIKNSVAYCAGSRSLIEENDSGKSFLEIADIIEANIDNL